MLRRLAPFAAGLLLLGIGFAAGRYLPSDDRRLLEECQDTLAQYVAASLED